jgi:hypothetical protein
VQRRLPNPKLLLSQPDMTDTEQLRVARVQVFFVASLAGAGNNPRRNLDAAISVPYARRQFGSRSQGFVGRPVKTKRA